MKKLLFLSLVTFTMLTVQSAYSQNTPTNTNPSTQTQFQSAQDPSAQSANVNAPKDANYGNDARYRGNANSSYYYGNDGYGRNQNDGYGRNQNDGYGRNQNYGYYNDGGNASDGNCCPADHACEDQAVGDCWCLMCHYEPCYYNDWKCVDDSKMCKKRCCRYVPKYYEVQKCRYVPQYYCETCCKQEPEYYDVEYCQPCKKWVCEKKCRYEKKYYYKHVCGDANCATPCPSNR